MSRNTEQGVKIAMTRILRFVPKKGLHSQSSPRRLVLLKQQHNKVSLCSKPGIRLCCTLGTHTHKRPCLSVSFRKPVLSCHVVLSRVRCLQGENSEHKREHVAHCSVLLRRLPRTTRNVWMQNQDGVCSQHSEVTGDYRKSPQAMLWITVIQ